MGRINLDEIQPGMVLASDVVDRTGRVLLKGGISMTDKHLMILRQWGVTDADILGTSREEVSALRTQSLDPEELGKAEAFYEDLFRHTDRSQPFVEELLRLSVLRHVTLNTEGGQNDNRTE